MNPKQSCIAGQLPKQATWRGWDLFCAALEKVGAQVAGRTASRCKKGKASQIEGKKVAFPSSPQKARLNFAAVRSTFASFILTGGWLMEASVGARVIRCCHRVPLEFEGDKRGRLKEFFVQIAVGWPRELPEDGISLLALSR